MAICLLARKGNQRNTVSAKMDSNDLGALKKYLDSGESKIHDYTKAIEYSYNVMPQLFRQDGDNVRQVNPDQSFSSLGLGASAGSIV